LDFSEFLSNGWLNDNHSRKTTDILGYPETTRFVKKGSDLPNGSKAKADGHWIEGYLLDTEKANEVWELAQSLQKTNRRLGLSVEGKILQRTGPDSKSVAKAMVRNVAITNCPVNTDATMDILAKSLMAVENSESEYAEKSLSMGTPANPGGSPVGPKTGDGAGQVLASESLEDDLKPLCSSCKKRLEKGKAWSDKEAKALVMKRIPNASPVQAERIIAMTKAMKSNGKI
jgi:hypothetical protein